MASKRTKQFEGDSYYEIYQEMARAHQSEDEKQVEIEELKEAIKVKDSVLLRVKSFMQSVTTDDVTDIFREALSVGLSVSNETKKEVNATK